MVRILLGHLDTRSLIAPLHYLTEVVACCEELGVVVLSVDEAKSLYKRADGTRPLAMARVFAELLRKGQIVRAQDFNASGRGPSVFSSAISLMLSPVTWALSGSDAPLPSEEDPFVFRSVLDKLVRDMLQVLSRHHNLIFDASVVEECVRQRCRSAADQRWVLAALYERGLVEILPRGSLRKLADSAAVSELEMTIYELEAVQTRLEQQEADLHKRSIILREQAREAVSSQRRPEAIVYLKRKRIVDAALEKRLALTTNVVQILTSVQMAHSSQLALGAAEIGNAALKAARVDPEKAVAVLEEFAELREEQEELANVLGQPGALEAGSEEESELMAELEAMQSDTHADESDALANRLAALSVDTVVEQPNPVVSGAPIAKKQLVLE